MKSDVASLLLVRPVGIVAREVPRVKDGMVRVVVVVVVVRLVIGHGGDGRVVLLPRPTSLSMREKYKDATKNLKCILYQICISKWLWCLLGS